MLSITLGFEFSPKLFAQPAIMLVANILPPLAQTTATLVGIAATLAGFRSILSPKSFAQSFGLPQSDPQPRLQGQDQEVRSQSKSLDSSNPFIPVVGVRNIATGLSILTFSLQNKSQTTGTVLLCNLAAMVGDTVICYRLGARGSETSHLVASMVFALLGGYMALQE